MEGEREFSKKKERERGLNGEGEREKVIKEE